MLTMPPRTIAMALVAALTGCGVIEDDRPTVVGAMAPVAKGVVIEDLPPLGPAPSVAVPPASGSTDRSAMGNGPTYGSTYTGAYQNRYAGAYEHDGAVVSYGYGSVYNGSTLYWNSYGYRSPYAYVFPAYRYVSPYRPYPYRDPSLHGYGYRSGFGYGGAGGGFYRGRTVAPIKKDKFIIDAGSEAEAFAALDRVMQDQGYELRHERANGQRVYVGRDRIKGNEVFYVARLNVNENRRGFAVRLKESIRPRDPTRHDGVGRLAGHRFERALEDESRSLRKQLKRAEPVSASSSAGLTPPLKATVLLSSPMKAKKVKPSHVVVNEPQRIKTKKGNIVSPQVETQFLSPRRAESLPRIQAPKRRNEGGGFRQVDGGKRKGSAGKFKPLP